MDVDIDPNDDKASQGDDAEALPTPGNRRPWNGNRVERPWGMRQGTRAEMK